MKADFGTIAEIVYSLGQVLLILRAVRERRPVPEILQTEALLLYRGYAASRYCRSSLFKSMTKLTIQVRTADNLLDLLKANKSGNWVVAQGKEKEITNVEIVSFDGTQKIEGTFDAANSFRLDDGRLVIAFTSACIRNCSISFNGQNPVRYF